MKCQSILSTLYLSPKLEAIVIRTRQGPLLSCVALYLLISSLSWLESYLQFSTALQNNLITAEQIAPDPTPAARLQAAPLTSQSLQWAPPSVVEATEKTNDTSAIPRIIHRTWRHLPSAIPSEWSNATTSCQAQNPSTSTHQFIARHFPWYLAAYTDHLLPMQRVDALRYVLLWHYGGVFLDPELGCRRSLEPLLSAENVQQGTVLLPQRWPYGVGAEMIASPPEHPFVIKLALAVHDRRYGGGGAQTTIAVVAPALLDDAESGEAFFVRRIGQAPRGDEVAVAEHVFGNGLGWCGAGLSLAGMALVIFGLTSRPKGAVNHLLV
ncbi:hypothetical protein BO86DRAFT_399588 [Aspergillus japonicus CBS 114.51]|uniref:Mannosyl phosphorylinositol ceramide synthase SUR1 n=1 Tax=Aspergillus japonicus CBS 114.51 TaxID=1448312 RepID=A0A8T8X298_ASPJA|nr:hypothetical protein BO86DRAFT_399588 [Aspergillus japonicus CBS 114.51]RAH81752.1 hypothetical protein BO86DRAFT_399588 [Aspergillus japonicus CBS 114.51]